MTDLKQNINLVDFAIKSLGYDRSNPHREINDDGVYVRLIHSYEFIDVGMYDFAMSIESEIRTADNEEANLELNFTGIASFRTLEAIDQSFIDSGEVKKYCAQQIYPYLKAYVSTFTANAGRETLYMPFYDAFDEEE